ncbi:hypothetical protein AYI69_g10323 [Smittium culicis]|uniref:Uncharacterized protein n=1 Tax=Smittium culicis TaxID=133412 RepID=A0A1R1X6I1_9FUNG|nr:hypothetical protein AYI69_g10323 [Smittium culicis]
MSTEELTSSIEDARKLAAIASKKGIGSPTANFTKVKTKKLQKKTPNSTKDQTEDQATYTSVASVEPNGQIDADEPSNVDQEQPKPLVSEQRRGTVGVKRSPASSIAMAESRNAEFYKETIDEPT